MATDAELLAAVEAALLTLLAKGQATVTFGGKSVTYTSRKELMELRDELKARTERAGARHTTYATFERD